jgi:hypothetical protein
MSPSPRAVTFALALGAWLAAALLGGGTVLGTASGARAQGSLTPPAGQPRVTAPGGRKGRAAHRSRSRKR